MDPPINIETALEKKCKNHLWLAWIYFLTSTPVVLASLYLTSYVFLGGDPSFFCNVQELQEANWTSEQIKTISRPGTEKQSCRVYRWNYTSLKEMGFDEAIVYCNTTTKPDVINCKSYIYEEDTPHKTIVSQWDLVCENLPLRRTAQTAIAIGKFFGAFIFGPLADRFGRRKVFVFSCLLYITAGPTGAFVDEYEIFLILRILVGMAGSGVYETGQTLLIELTVKNYRAFASSLFQVPASIGIVLLPVAAYYTDNWRHLQLAISLPTVFLLIHCWYFPESPRWLITRGKLEKASAIIGSKCHLDKETYTLNQPGNKEQPNQCHKKVIFFLKSYLKLFSTLELTKRILICYFGWFASDLNYFVLIMNGTNFKVNEYLYVALNGIVEAPSYLIPPLMLTYFGRKSTVIGLFSVSGLAVLAITVIPQGWPVMFMAILGRITAGTVFAILGLQTSELIPTEYRNTAIGTSLAMGQLGVMAAPYFVEILGKMAWWIPSTLCGSLSLLAAFFFVFVPETRGIKMLDTLSEMKQEKQDHNKIAESAT